MFLPAPVSSQLACRHPSPGNPVLAHTKKCDDGAAGPSSSSPKECGGTWGLEGEMLRRETSGCPHWDGSGEGSSSSSPRECGGGGRTWGLEGDRGCMRRPVGVLTGMRQGWARRDSRVACARTRGTVFPRAGKREPGQGARRNWRQGDSPCFTLRSVLGTEAQAAVQPLGRRVSPRLSSTPSDVPSAGP